MKQFDSFGLDTSNGCLWRDGVRLPLPPKPFAVLQYLVENPGRLITHDELLDALWPDTFVQPQVLRTYMLELRRVLGDALDKPRYIQTLPKRGYCFVAPVAEWAGVNKDAVTRPSTNSPKTSVSDPSAIKPLAPIQPNAAALEFSSIIGRDDELARLKEHLDTLRSGQRRVVFVTGESGIGKTALIDAFCDRLGPSSNPIPDSISAVSVARGQCLEGFRSKEEYYPVMEALSQLCASPDGERACSILARIAPAWLTGHAPESSALSTERSASQSAVTNRKPGDLCSALEELSLIKSLVLIFEDIHWADDSTLHLISGLARRRAPARLLVLVTFRSQEVEIDHPLKSLKQDLLMRRLASEIALAPLIRSNVEELLIKQLRQPAPPAGLTDFVHLHSEGNPLFVTAILDHLIAQKFLVRSGHGVESRWQQRGPFEQIELGVPEGLAQMIELEIERLTDEEQRLLEAGSMTSVVFPAWAIAAALDQDADQVEEACDNLARRLYFVKRAGQDELPDGTRSAFYVFAHGIYRQVLYQRQTSSTRTKRHIRIAERLRNMFQGRESSVAREIAMHYEAAGKWQRAADELRIASRYALARHADCEAVQLLEHSLRLAENLAGSEHATQAQAIREELRNVRQSAPNESDCVQSFSRKA